jgi:tRNA-splicing ligase RtcB
MLKVLTNKNYDLINLPVKMWVDVNSLEKSALEQIIHLSNLPFAYRHIAIMPDCHSGYGMPIGGVLATEGVVVPNAVGVDIGCGMCAVKTNITIDSINNVILKEIMAKIRERIPLGKNHHKEAQDKALMPEFPASCWGDNSYIFQKEYQSALYQLGTLGGGNHFIEIQKDTDNYIWIMLHSGSRNIGYRVAKYYNELAYDLNKKWHSNTYLPNDKEQGLAFLPVNSMEGKAYLTEMQYCVDFALANRKLMMNRILDIFIDIFSLQGVALWNEPMINIAHNYAIIENHFGNNVIIHRKGATLARQGTVGIIPGSQGTRSYIVLGLGNPESFNSCSHGAGRKLGRNDAKKTLNLEAELKIMNDKGIIHGIRTQNDLQEAAGAYKDIDTVMKNQEDLVKIVVTLEPLAVVKGD